MIRALATLAVASLLAVSAAAAGNPPPARERGFNPEKVYNFNGVDTVDLFTGNLNLAIPLASYPVAADVSYSFVLRYSGNAWSPYLVCDNGFIGNEHDDPCHVFWDALTDAGLGWSVSFGRLEYGSKFFDYYDTTSKPRYFAPDGSEHRFYPTLHDPQCTGAATTDCDPVESGVFYTRDGSYLRLKELGGTVRIIEFPTGERRRFEDNRLQYIYGASSMMDLTTGLPVTNYVKFEYFTSYVKVTDSHGREHEVHYNGARVDRLRLAAAKRPEDPPGATPYAEYNLVYNDYTVDGSGNVQDGPITQLRTPCGKDPSVVNQVAIHFLTRLDLPHGVTWKFAYAPTNQCETAGALVRATLPTGGHITWSYAKVFTGTAMNSSSGVKERCLRTDTELCSATVNPNAQDEYTTYTVAPGGLEAYSITTVKPHRKNAAGIWAPESMTKNYFADNWNAHAGLPFGLATDATGRRHLSTQTYACDPENGCATTPRRKTYLRYEIDSMTEGSCNIDYPCIRDRNRRVASSRTVHVTNGVEEFEDTDYSRFDGLGHYRLTETSIGFNDTVNKREEYIGYNTETFGIRTGSGYDNEYRLSNTGTRMPGYTMRPHADDWDLGVYRHGYKKENGTTSYVEACFGDNGFLSYLRFKRRADGAADAHDVLYARTPDATYHPSSEKWFGGDHHAIGTTGPICSMPHPNATSSTFAVNHTYAYGVLETSKYTGMPFFSVDHTIDELTGLVRKSTDAAGVSTNYEYDRLGRLTKVAPAGLAATTYVYTNAAGTSAALVEQKTGTGSESIESRWYFDPYGRVRITGSLMPSPGSTTGIWSYRYTAYDGAGRQKHVTEAGTPAVSATFPNEATLPKTVYEYDLFGRPTNVKAPDQSNTKFEYGGTRTRTIRKYLATALNAPETEVVTTEEYDALGRLIRVDEPSGPTTASSTYGTNVITRYTYNVGGQLASVQMSDTLGSVQDRLFLYDGRGFLVWESHPESGMAHYTYDARGNVRSLFRGAASTEFDLQYEYDGASRVTRVYGRNPEYLPANGQPLFRILKEFEYGTANVAGTPTNWRLGKLIRATRYNYGEPMLHEPVYKIDHLYDYKDVAGRLHGRQTVVAKSGAPEGFGVIKTIDMSVELDTLGQTKSIDYPMCENCGIPSGGAANVDPRRKPQHFYEHGRLTRVDGYAGTVASPITYWPNGMRKDMLHANGIVDSQTVGTMPRPTELAFRTYDRCVAPVLGVQPNNQQFVPSSQCPAGFPNGCATLSVGVSGTAPFHFEWTNDSGNIVGTTQSITVGPPAAKYRVTATNQCGFVTSPEANVTASCTAPDTGVIMAVVQPDGSFSLRPTPTALASRQFVWRVLPANTQIGTTETITVPRPATTTTYSLTVTDDCGTDTSTVTVKVPLTITATGLTATWQPQSGGILVQWPAVAGATTYHIERRSGGAWQLYWTTASTSYIDPDVPANTTFAYRVYAKNADSQSGFSNSDVATTATYASLTGGSIVSAAAFDRMLDAVNSVREAAGWWGVSWAEIIGPDEPLPQPDTGIRARHLTACRARMNEALLALGALPVGYTDPDPTGKVIQALYLNEVLDQAK